MAQKVSITHVSDLSGKEIKDNDAPTVQFALDGTSYEIDLTDGEQQKLRDALASYINAGRKVGKASAGGRKSAQSGPAAKDIREWAKTNWSGEVPERGRIPAEVREAYDSAH